MLGCYIGVMPLIVLFSFMLKFILLILFVAMFVYNKEVDNTILLECCEGANRPNIPILLGC